MRKYALHQDTHTLRLELTRAGRLLEGAASGARAVLIALGLIVALTAVDLGADYLRRDDGLRFFIVYALGASLLIGLIAGALSLLGRRAWTLDARSATVRWSARTAFGRDAHAELPLAEVAALEVVRPRAPLAPHRLELVLGDGAREAIASRRGRARELEALAAAIRPRLPAAAPPLEGRRR